MTPAAEVRSLTEDQRAIYLEARSLGACHDDAMDAVETCSARSLYSETPNARKAPR